MGKMVLIVIGIALMASLAIWIGVSLVSVAGIETPKYDVLSNHDGYEIRQYMPYIAAEVTMEGAYRKSMNGGFRKLADYIFGNNTKPANGDSRDSEAIDMTAPVLERDVESEAIEMTAPVVEQGAKTGTRVVSFIMPSKYTMETIPKPNNSDVTLVAVPAKRFAVLRFSGRVSPGKAENMKQALMDSLKRDLIETVGMPMLAQYNPPWTIPFMRRNEAMVELKDLVSE